MDLETFAEHLSPRELGLAELYFCGDGEDGSEKDSGGVGEANGTDFEFSGLPHELEVVVSETCVGWFMVNAVEHVHAIDRWGHVSVPKVMH